MVYKAVQSGLFSRDASLKRKILIDFKSSNLAFIKKLLWVIVIQTL